MDKAKLQALRDKQVKRLAIIGDSSPYLRGARMATQDSIALIDAILEAI